MAGISTMVTFLSSCMVWLFECMNALNVSSNDNFSCGTLMVD